MSKTIQDIINELSADKYAELLGVKSDNPLGKAFLKRRPDHPNAGGSMVLPPMQQKTWAGYMEQTCSPSHKRAAYIHIPFCEKICLYCGFFQNYSNEERETLYIDALLRQLESSKQQRYIQDGLINAVFFGGGTPSTLSPENASRLLKKVRECLPLANDCEITMEARIHDLVDDKLQAWFEGGVNRISVGVQSFNTKVRQAVGRVDDKKPSWQTCAAQPPTTKQS